MIVGILKNIHEVEANEQSLSHNLKYWLFDSLAIANK